MVPTKLNPHSMKPNLMVVDVNAFSTPSNFPDVSEQQFILEERGMDETSLQPANPTSDQYKGIHLVILVHGFQGSSNDMKLVKNNLLLMKPELLIYSSVKNEDNTEASIEDMGRKLAEEVMDYIKDFCPGSALGRLSFIGYSLGGVIARESLKHLGAYHSKFHTFVTLSSPHMSFLYSSSSLIDAGMWLIKKVKKSDSLTQLTMSDASKLEDSFLYKLADSEHIQTFKNIVLFGSDQDTYSPFDSATIQVSDAVQRESR